MSHVATQSQEPVRLKSWPYKLAGILVSVLFVYLAVRRVNFSEAVRVLESARPSWLLAAMLVYLSSFPVRAVRWRLILRVQKAISLKEIMAPVLVGYMANNVLPARAGEVYRAHFLGKSVRMSRSGAVGSIVVERTFDGLMLIAVILLVLILFPQTQFLGGAALVTGLIFLALATGILLYGVAVDRADRIIYWGLKFLPPKLRKQVDLRLGFFLRGVRGISTVGGLLEAGAYTVVVWLLEAGAIALVVMSFQISLPPVGYLLVFALAALSTTLPSGPGYIGPYQYAFVLSLGAFAVSRETALVVSIASQLALLGSVTVIGLALLWVAQLRGGWLPTLKESSEEAEVEKRVG